MPYSALWPRESTIDSGRKDALNIYKKSDTLGVPTDPVYLSCHAHKKGSRDMPDTGNGTDDEMATEVGRLAPCLPAQDLCLASP